MIQQIQCGNFQVVAEGRLAALVIEATSLYFWTGGSFLCFFPLRFSLTLFPKT